ncbi:MAG TPA: MMPL family transporter [Usitatibacter sp.]|nr:MMPL family transporter [Usitatibacter sp.]
MSRHARLPLALWIVALALAAWQIAHTRFLADMSSFLPLDPTPEQRVLVDQLRDGVISRVILVGIESGDSAKRAAVSKELAKALGATGIFASISNGASAFERERELLLSHRYVLSPQVTPERFTVPGLRAAVGDTIDLLASPAGMLVKSLVPRDPTGEMVAVVEKMRPAQSPATADGVWVSADGERALLVGRTRAAGSDTDAQARAMATVEEKFAEVTRALGAPGMRVVLSGPGVFSVKARAMIQHDVERLAAASLAIVAALLLFVYRSPLALGLGMLPVASGALAGIAAVSLGFGMVHGITLGFGTTLIGEAVDYSIYLFVQRDARASDDWVKSFWPTVRLGVLTSIAGFAALLFSGVSGLAQLGVYSIAGLVAAALVTRFVLPSLLPSGFRIRDISPLGARLARVAAGVAHGRWIVAAISIAAAGVLVAHRDALWDPRIESLNPISAEDRALDAQLRGALGATDARHVIAVRGADAEAALSAAERMGASLDALAADGRIGGYESPARFLPSAAAQAKRLESLPPAAELRSRLREALQGMPLRAERLEPFLSDVERARSTGILTREMIQGTALGEALDGLLFRDSSGQWNAMLGLRRPIDADAVRRAIAQSGMKDAVLLDVRAELDTLYAGYFERALVASAVGLAAIVVLLAIALRSPSRVARVMAPLVAGVLVVAACHALAGTRMSLMHLVGLLLVVAVGSNYSLFFDRGSTARTMASLALANATTVASFGILALSRIPVLNAIGSTVALGALVTLIFATLVMPPVESPHAHAPP